MEAHMALAKPRNRDMTMMVEGYRGKCRKGQEGKIGQGKPEKVGMSVEAAVGRIEQEEADKGEVNLVDVKSSLVKEQGKVNQEQVVKEALDGVQVELLEVQVEDDEVDCVRM